ncbi:MAG: protein kinase [Planctomycetaceae bacterium]
MPDATLKSFLNLLKKSQLLNSDQLALAESLARGSERVGGQNSLPAAGNEAAVNSRSAAGLNTPELLATELVRRKMLTSWQRSQLLQGQSGFVLQQYRLQKPIGRGGMGHVFQALDTNTRAIVAIKVMAKKLTANQTLVNRFRREIKATSRLNCPHIVRTLDGGRVGDIDFMVMEFVNGDQLDDVTRRIPELPVGIACDIIRQAALGLQHAHEQKMVHRDIKPANLIIAWSDKGDGTVKLMDMGLVRLSEESTTDTTSAERAATRAGQVMGTPDYMSPEQAWDTATADIRSDIYSLGCSFFRMLTGRIPFPGDNPLQVLMNRCSKDAPSARSLRSDLPEEINAICQRMTLRDPDARFQTPAEVAAALEPFCEPLTVDALRKAARTAKAEDLLPLEPSKDSADEKETSFAQDASYQQFLKEMESGAAVDLLNSRSAQADGLPELSIEAAMANTVPDFRRPTSPVLTQRKQNRAAFRPGLIAAIASAVVLLPVGYILFSPDPQTSRNDVPVNGLVDVENKGQTKEANVDLPAARFASPDPVEVKAGDVVTFSPELSITRPANRGVLFYRLGPEAPTAATIDAETGDVTWQTTVLQKPVRYQIPIQLVYAAASTTPPVTNSDAGNIIADCTLEVAVTRESSRFALPILPPQRMPIGESSQISFATKSELPPEAEPEYQVIRGLMPGMQLDSVNGILRWNPAKRQIGRHVLTVQLTDKASDQILATTVYEIRVVPTVFSIQLIEPTTRSIAAGQTLQLNLVDASGM